MPFAFCGMPVRMNTGNACGCPPANMGFRSPGRSHNARSDKAVRTFALEKDPRTKTRFAAEDEGWWAWVELNYRPHPYQLSTDHCAMTDDGRLSP